MQQYLLYVRENNSKENSKNVHKLHLWKKKEFNFRPTKEI